MPSLRPLCPRFALHRYAQLRAWGRAFAAEHGRQPRLWIDKWCLDQRRITDTLPCLPIFLGGSQQLVLLVGPTFTQRLWCVIEIFTFMHMGGDMERIELRLIAHPYQNQAAAKKELTEQLATFDAAKAECFKHEDEQKLLAVIEAAFGTFDDFNERVRSAFEKRVDMKSAVRNVKNAVRLSSALAEKSQRAAVHPMPSPLASEHEPLGA